ncbi:MAG: short-chain dehydrogenase [Candidatus Poribacteria bacterium]|nr:MAG: short-chain dehydrogenase [Candidatus Poribacteria bacterium]
MSVLDRFRLDGRKAFVTGGSKGLGAAMAQALAEAGADVAIASRHPEECRATADRIHRATGRTVLAYRLDVADREAVQQVVHSIEEAFGRIDILINNAGAVSRKTTVELPLEEWQHLLDVNLSGPFYCAQAVLPGMVQRRYGRIINISSTFGAVGFPGRSPYTASKGGLLNMTRTWALEFAKDGITVNAICPGPFDTPMFSGVKNNPQALSEFLSRVPMGRLGNPEELGAVAVFLASEAASYITGAAIFVDGGWTAQ